jgi:hypothetical protein
MSGNLSVAPGLVITCQAVSGKVGEMLAPELSAYMANVVRGVRYEGMVYLQTSDGKYCSEHLSGNPGTMGCHYTEHGVEFNWRSLIIKEPGTYRLQIGIVAIDIGKAETKRVAAKMSDNIQISKAE